MIHVYTSAALNYLPKVRLLCCSIKQHHPDWVIHLALSDRKPDWFTTQDEPFDHILGVEELAIENKTPWLFFHNLIELSTAIKPFVLKHLLDQPDCDGVIYLDPDIVVFSSLQEIEDKLENANILLTPHLTKPEEHFEAVLDNEVCSLRHGIFNLGFVAVKASPEGKRFAQWWGDRLYHFCVSDWSQGLWTDQRWIDFAPVFFSDVEILKSSRFNVAPWNLSRRSVSGSFAHGFKVDGEDLGFYHFTGFDSGAHKVMSQKYAGDNAAVTSLVSWYEQESAKKDEQSSHCAWAYGTYSNGKHIENAHRIIYRQRTDLQTAYPNPFAAEGENTFYSWLMTQGHKEYAELR